MKCKFCDKDPEKIGGVAMGSDMMCDDCWEIHHRLGKVEVDAKIIAALGANYVSLLVGGLDNLKAY